MLCALGDGGQLGRDGGVSRTTPEAPVLPPGRPLLKSRG